MGSLYSGLLILMVVAVIGWYIWFRDEGEDEIQDIYKEVFGSRLGSQQDRDEHEFKEWWNNLSDEEKSEVHQIIHNPGGDEGESR
jgi:hypothetical protein